MLYTLIKSTLQNRRIDTDLDNGDVKENEEDYWKIVQSPKILIGNRKDGVEWKREMNVA